MASYARSLIHAIFFQANSAAFKLISPFFPLPPPHPFDRPSARSRSLVPLQNPAQLRNELQYPPGCVPGGDSGGALPVVQELCLDRLPFIQFFNREAVGPRQRLLLLDAVYGDGFPAAQFCADGNGVQEHF